MQLAEVPLIIAQKEPEKMFGLFFKSSSASASSNKGSLISG